MDLSRASVAVTGATGFLGRYIVDVFLRRGTRVVGVVRNPGRVPGLAARGVELRKADLAEFEELEAGFQGVDAVVSNAALFSVRNTSWDAHHKANISGARNVFEAAARAGVRRVVHVSSVGVYDGATHAPVREDHRQYSERSTRWPWTVYKISKAISEQLAWQLAERHGLELTVVRPCVIYGAFDPNWTAIFKWLVGARVGFTLRFARLPLVYAGDVADAIARCLERPVSIGKAYNITGDEDRLDVFVNAWTEAGGSTAPVMVPLLLPLRLGPSFDSGRAKQDLGWRNRSHVDGLRETVALEAEER